MFPYLNLFGLKIPMYGLMMALAFIAAVLTAYFRARKAGLNTDKLLNIAIISILSGIAGSYLLYIFITYPIKEIFSSIGRGDFSIFTDGMGFVYYGGLIAGVLAAFIYCKAAKLPFKEYVAIAAPSIPLAHAIGRVGCFCAGCCYGKVMDCPLSVIYTNPIGGAPTNIPVFPVQLLETLLNLAVFAVLLIYARKRMKSVTVLFLYLIMYAVERFGLEFLRADEIRGFFLGISTSQWISILLFVMGIIGFIIFSKKERKIFAIPEGDIAETEETCERLDAQRNGDSAETEETCERLGAQRNGDSAETEETYERLDAQRNGDSAETEETCERLDAQRNGDSVETKETVKTKKPPNNPNV